MAALDDFLNLIAAPGSHRALGLDLFGLVAAEAMACGLPVAAFDMGAAGEVIGDAGKLAKPGDVEGLARAIQDACLIDRTIARRRAVEMFSQDVWLARCEDLYAQLCSASVAAAA